MKGLPVHQIVSALADLPPASADAYIAAGFTQILAAAQSEEGCVALSVRERLDDADPLKGFRLMNLWVFGKQAMTQPYITETVMQNQDQFLKDPGAQRTAREAGHHRLYRIVDPRRIPNSEDTVGAYVWTEQGRIDEIQLIHTVSPDIELVMGFYRVAGDAMFDAEQETALAAINEALGAWARRIAFLHGFGASMQPLAPKEREALVLLLGSEQQKSFDGLLGVGAPRVNELVQSVHAKIGSANRAELQRRWMSTTVDVDAAVPMLTAARRRGARPDAPR